MESHIIYKSWHLFVWLNEPKYRPFNDKYKQHRRGYSSAHMDVTLGRLKCSAISPRFTGLGYHGHWTQSKDTTLYHRDKENIQFVLTIIFRWRFQSYLWQSVTRELCVVLQGDIRNITRLIFSVRLIFSQNK